MPVFVRRDPPPVPARRYNEYRLLVREDFHESCAYCLVHELLAGGQHNFELDHFKPKSKKEFEHLVNDFLNLYYSCHMCNHFKGSTWPGPELVQAGYVFVDLCRENYSQHFQEDDDGNWVPLSRAAEYTIEKLRLNRPHLVDIRKMIRCWEELMGSRPGNWDNAGRGNLIDDVRRRGWGSPKSR